MRDISNRAVCQITAQFEIFLSESHFQNHSSFNWTSFTVMHWTTKYTWVILTLKIEYKIARTWCTLLWITWYNQLNYNLAQLKPSLFRTISVNVCTECSFTPIYKTVAFNYRNSSSSLKANNGSNSWCQGNKNNTWALLHCSSFSLV